MDSRFPTYYLNDRRVLRLKPDAFRLFVFGTAWSVSNMTDGEISHEDLYLVPGANESDAEALVDSGLWEKTDSGFMVADFLKTQTSAAKMESALENRRRADAERQRKKREKDKAEGNHTPPDPPSRDSHVTVEGRGKAEAEAEEEARISAPSASEAEEPSPDQCSVSGCSGVVTDFLRRTAGQFCLNHAGSGSEEVRSNTTAPSAEDWAANMAAQFADRRAS